MDDYAGRVLADRYRLPLPPSDGYELAETRAFDTYSGQEVLVRQVPLPEVVDAEVLDADGRPSASGRAAGHAVRRSADPVVRRAIEAAQAAAQVPDHPRLDQVFDVFAEAGSLWIVSELVAARPLAALLAERPLNPYRAAEIGSDVLAALRVLHAHGWTHRNITVRTVLVCDDGRVMLTGLAAGAAEEALCGYAPAPLPDPDPADGPTTYGVPDPGPDPREEFDDTRSLPPGRGDAYEGVEDVREYAYAEDDRGYGRAPEYAEYGDGERYADVLDAEDVQEYDGDPGRRADDEDAQGYGGYGSYAGGEGAGEYGAYAGDEDGGEYGEYAGDEDRDRRDAPASGGLPVPPLPQGYVPREDERGYGREDGPYDREDGRYGLPPGREPYEEPSGRDDAPARGPARPSDAYEDAYDGGGEETRRPGAPDAGQEIVPRPAAPTVPYTAIPPAEPGASNAAQLRAARAGAIAAYRAGARAAARATEDRQEADRARTAPADLTKSPQRDGRAPHPAPPGDAPTPAGSGGYPDEGPDAVTGDTGDHGAGTGRQGDHGDHRAGMGDSGTAGRAVGSGGPGSGDPGATPDVLPLQRRPGAPAPDAPAAPRPLSAPWGAPAENPYDDEDDEDDDEGPRPPARRVHLAGTWDDGPGAGRPVPAGGSGADALRADSRRPGQAPPAPRPPAERAPASAWEDAVTGGREPAVHRGPATPLAAERARQARITVVGAVTERWAPEQAGPVHENWQLAPPIGPSTDLWALGALLYRAVQGHAPYPEENAAELVQMVCGEPPAFAEECGPLRPVVESLLRQDPSERPDVEELSGWLRSLVRSAPEPEAGADVVPLPAPDAAKLPVVRRRGELVRRRRGRFGGGANQGRHRQGRGRKPARRFDDDHHDSLLPPPERTAPMAVGHWEEERPARAPRAPKGPRVLREPPRRDERSSSPRSLGRLLLILILLLMAAAVAFAVMFMPKQEPGRDGGAPAPSGSAAPPAASAEPRPSASDDDAGTGSQQPQTSRSAVALPSGYALRKDAEGFEVGVPKDWQRSSANADRQIRYGSDGFTLLVVPGRDTVKSGGSDPLDYQRDKEPELQPFRDSSWSSSSGVRRVDVGRQAMAEGQFTWQESGGREVFVRNLAMIVDGRYHVIQVIGPENDRDRVTEVYQQAVASYRTTG
ncbi:protein kinase [Streptomyces sp. NRRL B-1381]|uniref:protein kinase n=1 Tax=Streptomyces sp. NRRL B-1381 TaxID=1463829 RepID=UPI0004C2071D|nr:protein kinase [Streptomyces sp. NRRL B-1381]